MRSSGVFTIILALCLLAACGGNSARQARNLAPDSNSSPGQAEGPYDLALNSLPADIHAEVDALVPPKGCNPALFFALKKSFVQALASKLASGGKLVSVPPMGDGNIVHGLTMAQDGGIYTLNWPYHNTGDYDQSGTVGITDITPIAMHFGHTTGTDPLDIVIDGDGLGSVGISDVTPLAMNFAVNVTSYRVEEATDEAGPYTEMGTVLLTAGTGADQGWMRLEFALPNDTARWLRVVPLDGDGSPGVASDAINFSGAGSLPEIISVSPTGGAPGSAVTFQAVVNGLGPFTYDWQFGGAAAPGTSADEQPAATLSLAPGNYDCSLEVSNASGSDTFDFVVSIGNPPIVTDVAPASGLAGSPAQFIATLSGDAPFTYEWDFAGGATPGTSAEESPNVTIGLPGIYDMASVSVSNAYGTVLYPFTLTVYSSLDPPVILNAGPTQVHAGDIVTFSATVSGAIPMAYNWDFGDAATPSTSFDPTPTVVITDTLTTFPIGLQVSNFNGVETFNFDLKVIDSALYDETEVNDDTLSANPLPAFPIAGWHGNLTETTDISDYFSFSANCSDRYSGDNESSR
jgi:PKD repeat protein